MAYQFSFEYYLDPNDYKFKKYKAIANEGVIWQKLQPNSKDWLVQPCKTEEFHLIIETLHFCYNNICQLLNFLNQDATELSEIQTILDCRNSLYLNHHFRTKIKLLIQTRLLLHQSQPKKQDLMIQKVVNSRFLPMMLLSRPSSRKFFARTLYRLIRFVSLNYFATFLLLIF